MAKTKWAVEYDQAAADAFKLNNPDAEVFCNNCNVLLRAAMAKAGILHDCDACDDCMEAAAALTPEYTAGLPLPGEVRPLFVCFLSASHLPCFCCSFTAWLGLGPAIDTDGSAAGAL